MLKKFICITIFISLALSFTSYAFAETDYSKASDWAKPELSEAFKNGLIPASLQGADMTKSITREEIAELAVKLYEMTTGTKAQAESPNLFSDTTNPEILKALKLGVTTGISTTTFAPKALTNREQVATMLSRTIRKMAQDGDFSAVNAPTFTDQKDISSWAQEHVSYMTKLGIIKGSGGKFDPLSFTTREQAIAMTLRTFNNLCDIIGSETTNTGTTQSGGDSIGGTGAGSGNSLYKTPKQPQLIMDDKLEILNGNMGRVAFRISHLLILGEHTGFNLYYTNDYSQPDEFEFDEAGFYYEEELGKTVELSVTCVNHTAESTPLNLKFAMLDKVKGDTLWSERQTDDLFGSPCWYGLSWGAVEGATKYKVFVSSSVSDWLRFVNSRDLSGFSSVIVSEPYFSTKQYTGLPDDLINASWGEERYVVVFPMNEDNEIGPFPRYYKIPMTGVSSKAYN